MKLRTMLSQLALLILVALPQLSFANASSASQEPFREILKCDLVVRGKVVDVDVKLERMIDAAPFMGASDPTFETRVAHVTFAVEEVLRGQASSGKLEFLAYYDISHLKDNYEAGQEMIVGLTWGADVLGGAYTMLAEARRFLRTAAGWERQSGSLVLQDLSELRALLDAVSPGRILADADVVISATLTRAEIEYLTTSSGGRYALKTFYLDNIDFLKGDAASTASVREVKVIASGDYWPAWRDSPTYPQNLDDGHRYCFFLRRADEGYTVLRGLSGVYEIQGDALVLPRRRSVGLTVSEVRSYAEME